ncbi:3-phenylpropionate/trans-cinnamate dioxygenase ferredoxin reductase subunit [Rhodovulum imhoffii]|uniref:3-phenylpropionate/trans-cinnamate dioxygenase ferredoxin reductase subunit n=1 Tax=Rhodovulum imhoffii TaxID=365340 RepID=A0A2T5BU52_9RHOB|nr:FAD-dependent oxidoreductase [Rhodovulum imhoffii]MBK5934588.1 pyridine nucleotide-disulfide oxidoreductase [Rhodovulum imhoffii]PTN02995.1 3-phenylpropionate/trans-cinnamate dioxygenase ferredoxin reductase subunit [Rhodovulum imhoffii]
MAHIVITGAGQAGAALAARLRALEFPGDITLIGAEPVPPYQRPPLSKKYLLGELPLERLFLRPEEFYAENAIALRLGQRVDGIDPTAKTVTLGEEVLSYDQLALTTGAPARRLPAALGGDLPGVHVVRSLADVDTMAPEFRKGARVLIVGGGYIGLEAAAVAASKGLHVTLIEAADRILQRVAAPETSAWFAALHRGHGVDLRESTALVRLTGDDRVRHADLTDGTTLEVDFVIAGIGIAPATDLAETAGLACDGGIVVDEFGQTSLPGIWAAGDCAAQPCRGTRLRLESVQNAIDQAEAVAANMLGADKPYRPQPWFWSDQYDVKLQIAGLNRGYDHVIMRPGARDGSLSHWYFQGETLLAVDAMNDPRAYMIGKRLIENEISPKPESLADPDSDLRALLP